MHRIMTIGTNRTGISAAPERCQEMLAGMEEFPPSSKGSAKDIARVRVFYAKNSEPMGSMPGMAGVKNMGKTAVKSVQDKRLVLLMDKLGERLAFERMGTRMYEALMSKHEAFGDFAGGPGRNELRDLRMQQYGHIAMLENAIEQLGGDATAITPSANIMATMAMGIGNVVTDPRTTLEQSLEAVLAAELINHACWQALVEIAEQAGENRLVPSLQKAREIEQDHLAKLNEWVASAQGR